MVVLERARASLSVMPFLVFIFLICSLVCLFFIFYFGREKGENGKNPNIKKYQNGKKQLSALVKSSVSHEILTRGAQNNQRFSWTFNVGHYCSLISLISRHYILINRCGPQLLPQDYYFPKFPLSHFVTISRTW